MTGKLVLAALLLICGASAYVLHQAFKKSPNYKSLATDQMKIELAHYIQLVEKSRQFKAAEEKGVTYFLDFNKPWDLRLQDKTVLIQAPTLDPQPSSEMKTQLEQQAKQALKAFVLTWLADKFHTQKDLLVEVRF